MRQTRCPARGTRNQMKPVSLFSDARTSRDTPFAVDATCASLNVRERVVVREPRCSGELSLAKRLYERLPGELGVAALGIGDRPLRELNLLAQVVELHQVDDAARIRPLGCDGGLQRQ